MRRSRPQHHLATTKFTCVIASTIPTLRLRTVVEWLRFDAIGKPKPVTAPLVNNEVGESMGSFRTAWATAVLKGARCCAYEGEAASTCRNGEPSPPGARGTSEDRSSLARPAARIRVLSRGTRCPGHEDSGPTRARRDHDDDALHPSRAGRARQGDHGAEDRRRIRPECWSRCLICVSGEATRGKFKIRRSPLNSQGLRP